MSLDLPALRARDREQLDRVARAIREERRAFFVIACPPEVRDAARAYLAQETGRDIEETLLVRDHDAMVVAMLSIDGAPRNTVSSLRIDARVVEVMSALNWHREKLHRAGQVLLWLDSPEDVRELQDHAPDAYSFREAMLVLVGGSISSTEPRPERAEEPADIRAARLLYELPGTNEARAAAAGTLAVALFRHGHAAESMTIAREGIQLVPRHRYRSSRHRQARWTLLDALALAESSLGRAVDAFRHYAAAADEAPRGPASVALASASFLSPLGGETQITDQALFTVRADVRASNALSMRAIAATERMKRGLFRQAIDLCRDVLARSEAPLHEQARIHEALATTHLHQGRFRACETEIEVARSKLHRAGWHESTLHGMRELLALDMGEAALVEARHAPPEDREAQAGGGTIVHVDIDRSGGLVDLRGMSDSMEADLAIRRDTRVFTQAEYLILVLGLAEEGALSVDREAAIRLIDRAAQALIDMADDHPPWYVVLVPGVRALARVHTQPDDAITLAEQAISLAKDRWKQALPRNTRILVECLARAGRWSEMDAAVQAALEASRSAEHLRELAKVQAYNLVRLLHLGAPQAHIDGATADLESTFAEMDAPRVEGETWLEVAPLFPLLVAKPDPVEIADRLHGLFLDMPMPGNAARAMEWLGDIHVARGDSTRAERCYRLSLGTLERYGPLLRKALIDRKLAALSERAAPEAGC